MRLFVIAQGSENTEKHGKCCGQKAKSEFPCGYTLGNVTLRGKPFPGELGDLVESRCPRPAGARHGRALRKSWQQERSQLAFSSLLQAPVPDSLLPLYFCSLQMGEQIHQGVICHFALKYHFFIRVREKKVSRAVRSCPVPCL